MPVVTDGGARALPVRDLAGAGVGAGLKAGAATAVALALIAEISDAPTALPGIRSSTWTPTTAIASFVFGQDAFHGDFAILPILAGLALLALVAALLGVLGVALLAYALGPAPGAWESLTAGLAYGLVVEIVGVNVVVNLVQGRDTVYDALPRWGWWVALATYGAALGLTWARRTGARLTGSTTVRQAAA